VLSNKEAEANVALYDDKLQWLESIECSSLPIEFAAQLFGAHYRLGQEGAARSGYISKVSRFEWVKNPVYISRLIVSHEGSNGDFHDFSATYFDKENEVCAQLKATLFVSYKEDSQFKISKGPAEILNINVLSDELFINKNNDNPLNNISVLLNENCPVYTGHFPNNPITPGVLLVDSMLRTAHESINKNSKNKFQLEALWDVVFQNVTFPGDSLIIKTKKLEEELNAYVFSASIFNDGKRCVRAKFKLKKS